MFIDLCTDPTKIKVNKMLYADDINLFLLYDLYIQNEGLLNNLIIECTDQEILFIENTFNPTLNRFL